MFGFSFSELVVVVLVALVVMGPKDLPTMLRRLGQWAGKIRRAAADLRAQSGIDEALRSEGLADDIAEIRKLARGELDAVRAAATIPSDGDRGAPQPSSYGRGDDFYIVREREYPREGADAYGALPDNAIVYAEGLAKSALARDPLYVLGDETAKLPDPEPEPAPANAGVGPTLMGVGASELDRAEPAAPPARSDAPAGEVGPTLMGVGAIEAPQPSSPDDGEDARASEHREEAR